MAAWARVNRLTLSQPYDPNPRFEHDCEQCQFLGRFDHDGPLTTGKTLRMKCDLYFCPSGGTRVNYSLIARHSDRDGDYSSSLLSLVVGHRATWEEFPSTYSAGLIEALRRYEEMKIVHLVPAAGRDYASRREIEGSLLGGLDFLISDASNPYDGKPINLPQIKEAGYTHVQVRYGQLRKLTLLDLKKLEPR